MPTYGCDPDWNAIDRARKEVCAQLVAKGLMPDTSKFSEVMRRKLKKRGF